VAPLLGCNRRNALHHLCCPGCAGLGFEIIDHVMLDLIPPVRMIVIDRQCSRPGEPKYPSALAPPISHELRANSLETVQGRRAALRQRWRKEK
jgi:hypothetical protein